MTIPEKGKAWIYYDYGPKENLSLTEIDVETPAAHEVLVQTYAAALNPADYKRLAGVLKGREPAPPTVPGFDIAGIVVKLGSTATKFKVGDRVFGDVSDAAGLKQIGSLSEYCAVQEKFLHVIPERLSFVEAASLPVALLTAYQALERAGLKEGQTVLILGGAGGVGSLAVQLTRHVFKASSVTATASGPKLDLIHSLGANAVIDYKKAPLAEHPSKYDVVLDTVGTGEGILVTKESGFAVTIAGQPKPPEVLYWVTSRGSDLEKLSPLFEDGTLKPVIDSTGPYKFEDVVEAFGYLERGGATGKVVITLPILYGSGTGTE